LHVPKQTAKEQYDWLFNEDNETPRDSVGIDGTTNAHTGLKREDTNLTDTLQSERELFADRSLLKYQDRKPEYIDGPQK
jgi:hypothetical protein